VVAGGVGLPVAACFGPHLGDVLVVVAEGVGDDGCRGLEDELPEGGHSGGLRGDAELVDERQQCSGVEWLACPLAGEQPAAIWVGGAGQVLLVRDELEQNAGECFGDW
jgi:hypothetical protein